MTKKEILVVFIDNNRFLFYTKKASNTLQLNLLADVICDLEIVNKEKLEHLIDSFFQSPNFKGQEFDTTVIFSQNLTFEKELTSTNSKAEFEETQKFLDMVPFEEVLNNSYRINKKTKIVAANKVLYNILKQIFEKNKAHILLVLPMSILVTANPELANKIDFPFIEGKLESFKQYSLIDFEEMGLGGEITNSIGIKKKDVRLYALIIVMIVLFLVMIILIYTTFIAVPKNPKLKINQPSKILLTPDKNVYETPVASESGKTATPSSLLTPSPSQ
jgi:hypothetical protein